MYCLYVGVDYTYIDVNARMYVRIYVCMYVRTYLCMYLCMYVYVYVYEYIRKERNLINNKRKQQAPYRGKVHINSIYHVEYVVFYAIYIFCQTRRVNVSLKNKPMK